MPHTVRKLLQKYNVWRWRRAILASLALHRRGEARSDGLGLVSARANVEICWRARAPHPWDCDSDGLLQTAAFTSQAFDDTESALCRLFEAVPGAESIDLKVLDQDGQRLIIEGRVFRRDFQEMLSSHIQSVRMRLIRIGVRDYLSNEIDKDTMYTER